MPVQLPHWTQLKKLSGANVIVVLGYLCDRADSNGIITVSYREMDRDTGINAGSVGRHVQELEAQGFIGVDRSRDGRNVYRLLHAQASTRGVQDLNRRAGSPDAASVSVRGVQPGNLRASALQSTPNLEQTERPVIHVM